MSGNKAAMTAYNAMDYVFFEKLSQRGKSLYMFRSIMRLANHWDNEAQKNDIRNECRATFHKNKYIEDDELINDKIEEARSRMLTALHYRIPYEKKKYNIPKYALSMAPVDPKDDSDIC
ncbi:hypothetical protein DICPUDRAFT_25505 [Dictyostelium purpureum]|uniref:Complex 1 LYR protein domain-containing protein n=1 Tax=Dictyostelium purpureum TaxID=5786 RepID=F0Z772_DICPU|nr:uncharacterized protein DICPUDRAFT_25505 [Dictyostelium purpureum]EGC40193.1 hypothetical protein DICPUDRAFT_25505 [Dictyostelium purpureum]|eukprot:XP_003283262.1 hypothetical protein DICPUDRAFT_25505 [Dictyostelium purpureum]